MIGLLSLTDKQSERSEYGLCIVHLPNNEVSRVRPAETFKRVSRIYNWEGDFQRILVFTAVTKMRQSETSFGASNVTY